nr:asparagine synthase-related protein [Actinopolyspora alba]
MRILPDRKDRMSMAVGLEVRVPFCDHRLVEHVFNAPRSLKTHDGGEKSLLRGAVADVLPRSVLDGVVDCSHPCVTVCKTVCYFPYRRSSGWRKPSRVEVFRVSATAASAESCAGTVNKPAGNSGETSAAGMGIATGRPHLRVRPRPRSNTTAQEHFYTLPERSKVPIPRPRIRTTPPNRSDRRGNCCAPMTRLSRCCTTDGSGKR